MIRENKKLPDDILDRIPLVVERISQDTEVIALYAFGSLAAGQLKPLSDLDFGVLVVNSLNREARFEKHLDLIGLFNRLLKTDEVDLILMNDAPLRFCYRIIKTGKLLHCADRAMLSDFTEKIIKLYLDFKYFQDRFDDAFLEGLNFRG